MEHITIGHIIRPRDVIDVLHALNIHGKTLKPIGDLHGDGLYILTADLLEVRELRDLHPVQPDLPAKSPRAQRRRLPVVLDKADVVLLRVNPEAGEALKVKFLNIVRRRLHDHLELMMLIETIRVVSIASVRRAARGLHIGDIPRLRPQNAQERPRAHRPCALFYIIGLGEDTALPRPELLQCEDNLLKFHANNPSNRKTAYTL